MFNIGSRVMVDCIEGLGGPATVIAIRNSEDCPFRVSMDDNNPPPFWAYKFELSPMQDDRVGTDARRQTLAHIGLVRDGLHRVISNLSRRAVVHDASKLESPEAECFDEFTAKLAAVTYGSDEYRSFLAGMKPALDHHYAANDHHPEHFEDGIQGMSLVQLIEMLVDWLAATKRHHDGDIRRSIEVNQKRFGYTDELKRIFLNTLPLIESEPT